MALFSKKLIIAALLVAIVYVISVVWLMNFSLVLMTVLGNFPIEYKFKILFVLLKGMWVAMTHTALFLLLFTAFLTGINIVLIGKRIIKMKRLKNIHYIAGLGSLFGIIGSGCAACGLPIISLLGLSGSIAYLPLHGTELSYLAVALLLISLVFMIKSNRQANNEDQCLLVSPKRTMRRRKNQQKRI
ncbi:hypothetical protein M1615_04515 [Patescibacteria group bacterium]|nr:hypothetical protein [Patescibacteria group bacterium]